MKLHITEQAVKEAVVPTGRKSFLIFDTELTGFAVQKTVTGNMSYVILYRNALRQQRQEKLSKVGQISAQAARALARAQLARLEDEQKRAPSPRLAIAPTMDEFFYKTYFPKVKLTSRSHETHASIYRNHVQAVFGARRLNEIDGQEIVNYANALKEKPPWRGGKLGSYTQPLAEGTVKRILILVRHLFNEALREPHAHVTSNPTHAIRLTTTRKIVGRFLTKEQLANLLESAKASENPDLADIVRLMGATGLRRNNVLNMQWSWFDSARGTLNIPAEADKAKKGFVLHLATGVVQLLQRRLTHTDSRWVFPNPKTGKPYHSCRCAWVRACSKADLSNLRMHDLRHTCASMMLESGADIVDVQQALGHTQLKTTAGYLHLTEGRKRETANAAALAMGIFD